MTLEHVSFCDAGPAIAFLEELAGQGDYLFRGHTHAEYRLVTTLERFRPGMTWSSGIDDLIDRFRVGLARLDIPGIDSDRRLDWLEHARHHGVPAPVLDFSYSPYVALFFALSGVSVAREEAGESAAVYAVDMSKLAVAWATNGLDPEADREDVARRHREFLYPDGELFEVGFPMNRLQFIPHPGRYSHRMHRQQGAFLYDTYNYMYADVDDLDGFIEAYDESIDDFTKGRHDSGRPAAYKIDLHVGCDGEVFERLELMGITGGMLMMNADGVAIDVENSMSYHSRVSYLRDIRFPRSGI